jgi:hypothetical protein
MASILEGVASWAVCVYGLLVVPYSAPDCRPGLIVDLLRSDQQRI